MEIENLRAIYLPDLESTHGPSTYTVMKTRDGLHWDPDTSNLPDGVKCASFDVPFINEDWMIMQSVLETDSEGNEIFEMDIVEVEGQYQKHFVVVRAGYSFVLFDGHSSILSDPQGEIWKTSKVVCPIWESSKVEEIGIAFEKPIQSYRKF